MTTVIAEVYEAFRSAGAQEDKALAAASAIADCQKDVAELRGDVKLIKWITGFNLAFPVTVVMLTIRLLAATASQSFCSSTCTNAIAVSGLQACCAMDCR